VTVRSASEQARQGAGLPVTWLVALLATVATVSTLLVFNADLSVTKDTLQRGVAEGWGTTSTGGESVDAAAALVAARDTLRRTFSDVDAVTSSLTQGVDSVATINGDLTALADVLSSTDAVLMDLVALALVGDRTAEQLDSAVARLVSLFAEVDRLVDALVPPADDGAARVARIARRLALLRVLGMLLPGD
jgi:ABC-type transporter Mla subunit MlaD